MEVSQAPVSARGEIQIAAPVEVVWNVLTRFEHWRQWTRT